MQYGVTLTIVRSDADCNGYPAEWEAVKSSACLAEFPEYGFGASLAVFDPNCRRPLK